MDLITQKKTQMVRVGKSLFERGLTSGSSGNISLRLDEGWLITPTNSCLGMLEVDDISHLDPDGKLLAGKPPSKELFLHQALLKRRPCDQAVVHLHSTYATALSCLDHPNPEDILPPLTPYPLMRFGKVALTPYRRPGDKALAEDLLALEADYQAILLANHGPLVAGADLPAAAFAIEELEQAAKLFLLLNKTAPRLLTADQVDELLQVYANLR